MTAQRSAIYAVLCSTTTHPTADELYQMVRAQTPGISLATVYNSLEMLVSHGLALKLTGERSARYDAVCTPHAHARCLRCDTVIDLPSYDEDELLATLSIPTGFMPRTTSIEVEGLCAHCDHDEFDARRSIETGLQEMKG